MRNQSGFTLMEMMVVMVILVGLAGLATGPLQNRANSMLTEATIDEINHLIDASQNYQFDRLSWPDEANNCAGLIAELTAQNFLNNVDIVNPFGNNYQTSCTPQLLTITNVADDTGWAQTIGGALPATTIAGVNTTTIIPRSGAIPAIVNKLDRDGTDGGMAANLDMNTNSITDVTNIQTTQINGRAVADYEIPAFQVSFFRLAACPAGWAYYSGAAGRTLVGAGVSDTNYSYLSAGGASTVRLNINQMPRHNHDIYMGFFGSSNFSMPSNVNFNIEGTLSKRKQTLYKGGNQAHENRMPYRTLMPCYKL